MKLSIKFLWAGTIAIALNTLILKVAQPLGIQAESGGLLKLVLSLLPVGVRSGFFHTTVFWYIFHFATGAVMVILYAVSFGRMKTGWFCKGLLFSLCPWLINGLLVLPMLHQRVFGIGTIPVLGIAYFFLANLVFGFSLVLALRLIDRRYRRQAQKAQDLKSI